MFAEVAQRSQKKLQRETAQNERQGKARDYYKDKCMELEQFLKDVSTSLRLTYTLPSTPGATPGGDDTASISGETDDGGNHITLGNISNTASFAKTAGKAFNISLNRASRHHVKSKQDASYYRKLYKKLRQDKQNMDEILEFHNCEAEPLPTAAEDDDAFLNSGPRGLNITDVDFERKILTLQNTQSTTINAHDYYLDGGSAGSFQLPRRRLWPAGNPGDKLQIGLGGSENTHGTELFWSDVLTARLAASNLQLKLGSSNVGKAIPGYKLARQTKRQQRDGYGVVAGRYMPPKVGDRLKIRTTIGTDQADDPIYKWVNGEVQATFPEIQQALVRFTADNAVRYVHISQETVQIY